VLKTEQSANEKVTLINETSNQLFVRTIINTFAVAIILTSRAFDSTFLCQKFYKRYKRRSLYVQLGRYLRLNFIPATGIVQGFCCIGETSL
jgi:ethanolamine transporter EutH